MTSSSFITAGSLHSCKTAFERLEQSVSHSDKIAFQSTEIEDVWQAARSIEREQRKRQATQNLRRIEPLLHALEKYSKPLESALNGTPYLPWIWVRPWFDQLSFSNKSIFF